MVLFQRLFLQMVQILQSRIRLKPFWEKVVVTVRVIMVMDFQEDLVEEEVFGELQHQLIWEEHPSNLHIREY